MQSSHYAESLTELTLGLTGYFAFYIEDPSTIAKILKHLGLPARAPPRAPARR